MVFTTIQGGTPTSPASIENWRSAEEALTLKTPLDFECFPIRDPNFFVAKQLGEQHIDEATAENVKSWLMQGVAIEHFLRPSKGCFQGTQYDLPSPSYFYQEKSKSCTTNPDLIAQTLEERLRNGSLNLLGHWETLRAEQLPVCIMPLTLDT